LASNLNDLNQLQQAIEQEQHITNNDLRVNEIDKLLNDLTKIYAANKVKIDHNKPLYKTLTNNEQKSYNTLVAYQRGVFDNIQKLRKEKTLITGGPSITTNLPKGMYDSATSGTVIGKPVF